MRRRTFIRLAGGGAVVAAGAGSAAWELRNGFPAAAVEAWNGPAREADPRRRALAYAITAPNPHNLQPWRADLREAGAITLCTDPRRVLPATDPDGRQILVGHGAFLELLVIALAGQGLRAEVSLWPDGELPPRLAQWDGRPVARLQLAPGAARDPLFAHILARHTPKSDFDTARPVAPATLQALLAAARGSGLVAGGTVGHEQVAALRRLCADAAEVELRTPAAALESLQLTRIGPREILRHRDGIALNDAVPRVADALGLLDRERPPAPGSLAFAQTLQRLQGQAGTAMGFVWLATPGNTRTQQLEAGRAFVRLQLRATALGVGVHPLSQALQEYPQMQPLYEQAHRLLLGRPAPRGPADATLQMLCRIGSPSRLAPATPRRPLATFLA